MYSIFCMIIWILYSMTTVLKNCVELSLWIYSNKKSPISSTFQHPITKPQIIKNFHTIEHKLWYSCSNIVRYCDSTKRYGTVPVSYTHLSLMFIIINAIESKGIKVCSIVSDLGGCGTLWKELLSLIHI